MTLFRGKYRVESARNPRWEYSEPGWYFVTICTAGMKCWLGRVRERKVQLSRVGAIVEQNWQAIPTHYTDIKIDEFIVMPNHVHGIIVIEGHHQFTPDSALMVCHEKAVSLGDVVGSFKAGVTRCCRQNGFGWFAWQERFYDKIIRGPRTLSAIREYIWRNPENWMRDEFNPRQIGDGASPVSTPR